MKTVGIIVEYNPLHNGHVYHFQSAVEASGADACVAVMSGNFLQRGEPALVSKLARAEMALKIGIDLVIELPFLYATANAELFAHGAISILDRLGVVDELCFGSESGDISWMIPLASALADEPPSFSQRIKEYLATGMPYPRAYAKAASDLFGTPDLAQHPLELPNNILGLNYLIALQRCNSSIRPLTIRREKAGYHQENITDRRIASATAIRKLLLEQGESLNGIAPYVPPSTLEVLQREFSQGTGPIHWERFWHPLFHRLLQLSPGELAQHLEVEEGVEHRIRQSVLTSSTVEELISRVKSKRYTWNRIQRMLLSILLGIRKEMVRDLSLKSGAPYARVLAFSPKGRLLLKKAKEAGRLPLITNVRDGIHPMLDLDIAANALYRLASPSWSPDFLTEEYRSSPIQLDLSAAAT